LIRGAKIKEELIKPKCFEASIVAASLVVNKLSLGVVRVFTAGPAFGWIEQMVEGG
jgi:hypothetical protein